MSTITASPLAIPTYAARRRPQAGVRLTRRGRLVVFVLALAFVLAVGMFLGARSVATGEAGGAATPTERIVITPGDTLWAIAAERADDGEIRAMVDQIEELNALDSATLYVGQELFVPVAD